MQTASDRAPTIHRESFGNMIFFRVCRMHHDRGVRVLIVILVTRRMGHDSHGR
jgi:hypothetical protein